MRRACLVLVLVAACAAAPKTLPTPIANTPPRDCASDQSCATSGYCVARGDACVPGTAEDCSSSLNCATDGRCTLAGDRCIATSADCLAHGACISEGACTPVDGVCTITSDADCRRSEACTKDGDCTFHPASNSSIAVCGR